MHVKTQQNYNSNHDMHLDIYLFTLITEDCQTFPQIEMNRCSVTQNNLNCFIENIFRDMQFNAVYFILKNCFHKQHTFVIGASMVIE